MDLQKADIVLPSLDAVNEVMYRKINRPHRDLTFDEVYNGLREFSKRYKGQLWIEIMLIKGLNDDFETLMQFSVLSEDIP